MKLYRFLAAVAGALAFTALAPSAVSAQPIEDPVVALRDLCDTHKGDFYVTPYNRARCQGARVGGRRGTTLELERDICVNELDGIFNAAPSTGRRNRVTWVCI
jgi:hypothetical protein